MARPKTGSTIFFEPINAIELQDLCAAPTIEFFPQKWNRENLFVEENSKWTGPGSRLGEIYFLSRHEKVAVSDFYVSVANLFPWVPDWHPTSGKNASEIFRYLISKYLRRSEWIKNEVDSFYMRSLNGKSFTAAHLRGSDKILEAESLGHLNEKIVRLIERRPRDEPVFLMTDDSNYLELIRDRFPSRVVFADCMRTSGNTGVHYLSGQRPLQLGMEVMRDTYLALKADHFIGNGSSNIAGMIALMRDWQPGSCELIYPANNQMMRNAFLYLPPDVARLGVPLPGHDFMLDELPGGDFGTPVNSLPE